MSPIAYDFRPLSIQQQDVEAAGLASSPIKILQRLQNSNGQSRVLSPSVSASNFQRPSIPNQWPTFANEAERNIAMATGTYSPEYISPLKMLEHQALTADAQKDVLQRQAYEASSFPVIANQSSEDRQRALLAGDVTGLAGKLLHSGYAPSSYGQLDLQNPTKDRLDREIYDHPEFQKALAKNPAQAAFTYQRLTGRTLEGDTGAAIAYRDDRAKFGQSLQDERAKKISEEQLSSALLPTKVGRSYAEQQIKGGAVYDPAKQSWKVWNTDDAPVNPLGGLGQIAKPYRQLVDATEDQNRLLNQHYSDVTGRTLPEPHKAEPVSYLRKDPEIATAIAKWEAAQHRTIQDDELARLGQRVLETRANQAAHDEQYGFKGAVRRVSHNTLRAIAGRPSMQENPVPVFTNRGEDVSDANLNWWGKYMKEGLQGQVDPNGNYIIPTINRAYNYLTDDLWQQNGPAHQLFDKLGWANQPVQR